ncbi:CsbD family protein [Arthrobacter sp. TMP15]|uniref:CsbD family protein n=1 Tax=Arthrobacter sp. TMP15 TaxID=3140789 RepID=UPI0031BB089B
MGIGEKFDAAKDKIGGKIKETVGRATDDHSQIMDGKLDQARGVAKDKLADAKAHLEQDVADLNTDDTEGGAAAHGV